MIGQKKIIKIRLIAIFGLYFWSTQLLHAQTYTLRTSGFSNGAGNVQSTTYKLNATVGQDIVGRVSSANYQLLTGYVPSSSGVVPQLPDLDLQQPNINPVSVAPGKTTAATFILKNIGDGDVTVPLVVKAYLSVNSTWDAGDTELASFVLGNSLAKGAQISFPQTGQSNLITIPSATALGSYQIILVADPALTIEEKNETNNIRSLALTVAIGSSSDDTTPPSFGSITKPARFGAGQQVSLSNVTDPSGIKEVLLVYRPILANTFAAPVATTASGSTYSVSLTASWADQLGIEFYFRATDNANNSAETQRQFLYMPSDENLVIPNLAAGGTLADYRIFSIPYKLDKASIADVFGPTFGGGDKTKWRIVRYQNGRNVDYPEVITS
ncbi:MAG: hypothetical protein K2U26_09415, partial [Cyclobacteriaceae bacterium]|nr:hypothetical protein [Cyclobacteriaceae bacterium]